MPRAVPAWLHRVCIRMHGPADPWTRLMLFALNTFMGEEGESYQGQEALAKAACMGVSTVRNKVAEASQAGWIALYPRGRSGQRWKSYMYRCCVPDWIDLSQIKVKDQDGEYLAAAHEAKYGTVPEFSVKGSLYPQKGKKRQVPPAGGGAFPSNPREEEPSTASGQQKHRQPTAEAPPAETKKDRQPVRGKYSSEVLTLSNHSEGPLSRTADDQKIVPESKRQEPKPAAGPERFARPTAGEPRGLPGKAGTPTAGDDPDLRRRIRAYVESVKQESVSDVARVFRTTIPVIESALAEGRV